MFRLAWGVLFASLCARAETVWIAGTEWPPYMSEKLPGQGAASAVVREAFRTVGVEVRFDFLPWQRTVKEGTHNPVYIGYMPAYFSVERSKEGYVSDQIAVSSIGFAKSNRRIFQWNTESDLARYKVGLVKGYVNTPEFDRRLKAGDSNLDLAVSDENNLVKLAAGRIDLALIDKYVFAYYQKYSKEPGVNVEKIDFQGKIIEVKPVYIFFQKTIAGQRYRNLFHKGMQQISPQKVFLRAMQSIVPGFSDEVPKADTLPDKPQ